MSDWYYFCLVYISHGKPSHRFKQALQLALQRLCQFKINPINPGNTLSMMFLEFYGA
jgi:hypothetical protein